MLAFAHIPTAATASEGFNIDEVNNKFAGRRAHCDRSRHRNRQGYTFKTRLRLSHTRGPLRLRAWRLAGLRIGWRKVGGVRTAWRRGLRPSVLRAGLSWAIGVGWRWWWRLR
jgi:hypothetical protein